MTALAVAPKHEDLARRLESGVAELGLDLGRDERSLLLRHLELLEKWNRIHNLTAIRDRARALSAHLLDSLAVVPHVTGARVLDAGSGAGFPGIPIAVARPHIEVELLDASHKKCAFLRHAVAELGLKNARAVCERAESWRPSERFDFIVSRALASLHELIALTAHLLAPGGVIAAMKGVHPFEEIERIPPDFRVQQLHALSVPGLHAERHLVLIERA